MQHKGKQRAGWKGRLQALIDANNGLHSTRGKVVGHKTRDERAASLFRIFKRLRAMGFKLDDPAHMGGRHIGWLMRDWTADPTIKAELATRGVRYEPRDGPLSPAYIQQQLSFLRALSAWIGKPGLVLPAEAYVAPHLVARQTTAQRDRSWSGDAVDPAAVLAQVASPDPRTALILEVMLAFGLRRKEAVMFVPTLAEVPAHALPSSDDPGPYLAFLRIKRGTKAGRLRYTAIRHPSQAWTLERALEAAPNGGHIGYPGLSLKQALRRFSNTLHRAGVNMKVLGVTGHGLRHQFAADLYVELAEVAPPVRGGGPVDAETLRAAYLAVAEQLGHGRPQIAGAYLGRRDGRAIAPTAGPGPVERKP
jgi:integrase